MVNAQGLQCSNAQLLWLTSTFLTFVSLALRSPNRGQVISRVHYLRNTFKPPSQSVNKSLVTSNLIKD